MNVDVTKLSKEQRAALLAELQQQERADRSERRESYEALRHEFLAEVSSRLDDTVALTVAFRDWLTLETEAFTAVMREYGQVKSDDQAATPSPTATSASR